MSQHWDCVVYNWHAKSRAAEVKRTRSVRRFIVEAEDSDTAWEAARKAGSTATVMGLLLVDVEVMSVATATLPLEVAPR